jgi:hypothetical protein
MSVCMCRTYGGADMKFTFFTVGGLDVSKRHAHRGGSLSGEC